MQARLPWQERHSPMLFSVSFAPECAAASGATLRLMSWTGRPPAVVAPTRAAQ